MSRPEAKRQVSRVPGGFETDEDAGSISEMEEHSQTAEPQSRAKDQALAPFGQSMASQSTEGGGVLLGAEASTMEEIEIRKRLMEMDSSFVQQPSPVIPASTDDTNDYEESVLPQVEKNNGVEDEDPDDPETPAHMYKTPAPDTRQKYARSTESSPSQVSISSPLAEKIARSQSTTQSGTSIKEGYKTADDGAARSPSRKASLEKAAGQDTTPRRSQMEGLTSEAAMITSPSRRTDDLDHTDRHENSQNADEPLSPSSARKQRPRLTHRFTSQRLSYSSTTSTRTAGSEITLGADYALQSGGAIPLDQSVNARPRLESRNFSLASIASGMSGHGEGDEKLRRDPYANMGTLQEEGYDRDPATPTARGGYEDIPSDTVVARRVQEVEVPGTIIREYQARKRSQSPEKRNGIKANRNSTTLTLKEQGSTIDKLIKENFDLKLKIGFLNDALKKRSDESVSATISENVELKASKVTSAKEIRSLKKSIRDLERKLKAKDDELTHALNEQNARSGRTDHEAEESEELLYLRERISMYENEFETMRHNNFTQEAEKRKLVEILRSNRGATSDTIANQELDVWKDLLETETSKREQADLKVKEAYQQNDAFQAEIEQLRRELTLVGQTRDTTGDEMMSVNQDSSARPMGTSGSSRTLFEEVEHLRAANIKLQREVRAQTSMLTSRNKERDFLNSEIEELKMRVRGTSIAGDSIFERSASRVHGRPASGVSEGTRMTPLSESERDMLETKIDELREETSSLRIRLKEREVELHRYIDESENMMDEIDNNERVVQQLEQQCDALSADLETMQAERDVAIAAQGDYEMDLEDMRNQAQRHIDDLTDEIDAKSQEIHQFVEELARRNEERDALQGELHATSDNLARIEDDVQMKSKRIQDVEQEVEELTQEIDTMRDDFANQRGKLDRANVQNESMQKENAFLREEQESDKIKIGDLESDLTSEKSLAQELQQRLAQEKHQREVVDSKEKEDIQKLLDDLTKEAAEFRAEARDLKHSLQDKELEATTFKERLVELESNLREILGEPDASRSSMLTAVARLQQDLENTSIDLENTRQELNSKEHLLRHRDSLLESNGLEFRKLSDLLDRERSAHRTTKTQHEQWQRTHAHTSRTVTQKDLRISELEASRNADKKKLGTLENHYKDQLSERNGLLLSLWNKLAPLCGSDWQHQNSLVDRNHLPSMEVIATMLPPFSRNLLMAVQHIGSLLSDSKNRIHQVEQSLQNEYRSLEGQLEERVKKLDSLEALFQAQRVKGEINAAPEIAKLRGENRLLKSELGNIHKQEVYARAASRSSSSARARGLSNGSLAAPAPTLARTHSSAATLETSPRTSSLSASNSQRSPSTSPSHNRKPSAASLIPLNIPPPGSSAGNRDGGYGELHANNEPREQRWLHRLKELERRLKAEREARLLDRTAARKRIEESEKGREKLRGELERERTRIAFQQS